MKLRKFKSKSNRLPDLVEIVGLPCLARTELNCAGIPQATQPEKP